jgi:hypothetical protein
VAKVPQDREQMLSEVAEVGMLPDQLVEQILEVRPTGNVMVVVTLMVDQETDDPSDQRGDGQKQSAKARVMVPVHKGVPLRRRDRDLENLGSSAFQLECQSAEDHPIPRS